MNTIVDLIEQYPNLEYEDGYFYEDTDSEGYLVDDDMKPLDAHSYIEEFFYGESITLPNSGDPREDREQVMTGKEYISYIFNDDYNSAFRYIHPKNGVDLPKGQVDKEEVFQFHGKEKITWSDTQIMYIDNVENGLVQQLYFIRQNYPHVLKDFIDNHYGKTN